MFLVFSKIPIFFKFIPSASLVEREITSGRLLRRCDLAAIRTGVSEMPFASLERVFPVQGAITIISIRPFGPMGSACGMVVIGAFPVNSLACAKNSSLVPKREFSVAACSEKTGSRLAPVRFKSSKA